MRGMMIRRRGGGREGGNVQLGRQSRNNCCHLSNGNISILFFIYLSFNFSCSSFSQRESGKAIIQPYLVFILMLCFNKL